MWPAKYPLHAGRYNQKKYADEYAETLRASGENAKVVEKTVYDVIIIERVSDKSDKL